MNKHVRILSNYEQFNSHYTIAEGYCPSFLLLANAYTDLTGAGVVGLIDDDWIGSVSLGQALQRRWIVALGHGRRSTESCLGTGRLLEQARAAAGVTGPEST